MKVTTTSILTWPAKAVAGLFITLSIASSCSDPSSIGLDLDPNNNQIGVFYVEIPLSASMVLEDSFRTTNAGAMVIGGGTSDFFGKTEGIGFSRLSFEPSAPRPGQNATLDSVKFNFRVESVIGDNLSTPKTISVHLLTERILDTTYYNFDRLDFEANPIVQKSFNFSTRQDTLVTAKVDDSFSELIFDELKKGDAFRDIFTFRDLVPGIAFVGNAEEEASTSIALGNTTGLVVYYKNEGDSVTRTYAISTSQSRHFNYVHNDRTGTPTAAITQAGQAYDVGAKVGLKSNLGMLIRLDTSPIDAFLDTLVNVTFNDIEIVIGPLVNNSPTNRPPNSMLMYFTDENNRILTNDIGSQITVQQEGRPQVVTEEGVARPATSSPGFLFHNNNTNLYRQRMTSYMNAVYRLGLQRTDLLLYPTSNQPGGGDPFKRSFREFIVDQDNIKLKIYYSKIRAF